MEELVFQVRGQQGKYIAEADGAEIVTGAPTFDELAGMVRDAVECHFDPENAPSRVLLVFGVSMVKVP